MITDYATQDLETLYKYLAIDVSLLYYIENKMDDKLTDKQKVLYEEQVLPIAKILSDMVEYGTKIDKPYLEKLSVKMHSQSDRMKRALVSRVGKANFNPNSWQQVAEYVYDVLHIPNFKKRTTEAKYFNALIEDGMVNRKQASFLKLLVAYKQKTKLYSTYCVGILRKLDEDIIRTSYLVHGTVTGRLSSVSPNLQNIPARIGGLLKRAFIQRDGMILVEADYKQLEIRVLAWYSNDTRLLDILNSGRDVHTETASYIFKKSIEDVTEYERFIAKSVNFGIPYGIGADKLSKTIKRAVEEADEYIQSYYSIYDGVNGWILGIQDFVLANGYVELPTGRRRNFPLITRSNKGDILREAVNTMVQGMASEIVYNGMINVDRNMPTFNKLLTVHDSLLGECYEAEVHDCVTGLNNNLSDVSKLIKDPPIVFGVDCKVGYTWGDMNKWK
jgi:DNA polymerase-1